MYCETARSGSSGSFPPLMSRPYQSYFAIWGECKSRVHRYLWSVWGIALPSGHAHSGADNDDQVLGAGHSSLCNVVTKSLEVSGFGFAATHPWPQPLPALIFSKRSLQKDPSTKGVSEKPIRFSNSPMKGPHGSVPHAGGPPVWSITWPAGGDRRN